MRLSPAIRRPIPFCNSNLWSRYHGFIISTLQLRFITPFTFHRTRNLFIPAPRFIFMIWDRHLKPDCSCLCVFARNYSAQLGFVLYETWGTRWRSWLNHCATSRKVVGSIPDGFIGIFPWLNPSSRTMALWLTQPVIEISTRNISLGGKGCQCVELTTLPTSCADCLEILEPQPPGTLWACRGL